MCQLRRVINPLAIWLAAALIPAQSLPAIGWCCHGRAVGMESRQFQCCSCDHDPARADCSPLPCACRYLEIAAVRPRFAEFLCDMEVESPSGISSLDRCETVPKVEGKHPSLRNRAVRTTGNPSRCVLLCRFLI